MDSPPASPPLELALLKSLSPLPLGEGQGEGRGEVIPPLPVSEAAGEGVRPRVDGEGLLPLPSGEVRGEVSLPLPLGEGKGEGRCEGIPPIDPPLPPNNKPYLARAIKRCMVYANPDRRSRIFGRLRPNEIVQVIPYTGHWVRCGSGYILSVNKKHVNLIKVA